MPFQIPETLSCVQPYVLTATATVATGIILYLIKVIKEQKKENKDLISSLISNLKEQGENLFDISDKKTASTLQKLENLITKLEIIFSKR